MKILLLFALSLTISNVSPNNNSNRNAALPYTSFGEINSPCRTAADCKHYGYVCKENHTCQCSFYYIPDSNMKKCLGGVNQKCTYDEHCIPGAYCMNQNTCQCKADTPYSSLDGLECSRSTILLSTASLLISAFTTLLYLQ